MANHVIELITAAKDEWEASEKGGVPATYSSSDTQELVAALHTGKAFKILPVPPPIRQQASASSSPAPPSKKHCAENYNLQQNSSYKCRKLIMHSICVFSNHKGTWTNQNQHQKCGL